jgi:hypothetical protein
MSTESTKLFITFAQTLEQPSSFANARRAYFASTKTKLIGADLDEAKVAYANEFKTLPKRKAKAAKVEDANEPTTVTTKFGDISWRGSGYYRKTVVVFWEKVEALNPADSPKTVRYFANPQ